MNESNGKREGSTSGSGRGNNPPARTGNPGAPANARTVKSSAKTGTVSRSAARSAAKAVSNGR
jgi:hypothetical protein